MQDVVGLVSAMSGSASCDLITSVRGPRGDQVAQVLISAGAAALQP